MGFALNLDVVKLMSSRGKFSTENGSDHVVEVNYLSDVKAPIDILLHATILTLRPSFARPVTNCVIAKSPQCGGKHADW